MLTDLTDRSGPETMYQVLFEEDYQLSLLPSKVRRILDQLTPQTFDVVIKSFNDLAIDTEQKLRTCMELVYEKAVDDSEFSVICARVCEALQRKQARSARTGQIIRFLKVIIQRCQREFERDYTDGLDKIEHKRAMEETTTEERKKELRLEFEDKEQSARRRWLGNIRLIGELYKLKMLTARIMHECVRKLLEALNEVSLEGLCLLLVTAGKDLEIETNAKFKQLRSREAAAQHDFKHLDEYFQEIRTIIDSKKASSRVQCMLIDLTEVRLNDWTPRRNTPGPNEIDQKLGKKLNQLHLKGGKH